MPGRKKPDVEKVEPEWLSPTEVAERIGVQRNYVYKVIIHRVKTKKLGRLTKIHRDSLDKFMDGLPDADVAKPGNAT